MEKFKILSLSHGEDVDGIGSQAIIKRYFNVLNKPIFKKLLPDDFLHFDGTTIKLECVSSDYIDLIYYWAAIFAQNTDKINSEKYNMLVNSDDIFQNKWEKFLDILIDNDNHDINVNHLDKINPITKKTIIEMAENLKNINLIIITDLGFNESLKSIFPILENMQIEVAYFDHHELDFEVSSFFGRYKTYIIAKDKCASQIVKEYFLPDDEIAHHISELAYDTDYNLYKFPNSEGLMSYISRYIFSTEKIDLLRNSLAHGDFSNNDLAKLIETIIEWEKIQENLLLDNLIVRSITTSAYRIEMIIGVSTLKPGRAMRFIRRNFDQISQKYDLPEDNGFSHLILCLNTNNMKMNIRSNHFRVYDVAKHFGGGGHLDRAGFMFPSKFVSNLKETNIPSKFINIDELIKTITPLLAPL